jgi:low affinity Fe/Cu permease
MSTQDIFHRFAQVSARLMGSHWAFAAAGFSVLAWAASGPFFDYSERWQLTINTGTTMVTFLMVFLIQNAQDRHAKAMHLKLDELLRAVAEARTGLVNLEHLSEEELSRLQEEFKTLRQRESDGDGPS